MWHSSPRHQQHSLPVGSPLCPRPPSPLAAPTLHPPGDSAHNFHPCEWQPAVLAPLWGQFEQPRGPNLAPRHVAPHPDSDVLTLQELWDFDGLEDVLPPYMTSLTGTVIGQGRGLAVAWRRTLCIPGFKAVPAWDTREDLAVVLNTRQYGHLRVISTHMPLKLPDRPRVHPRTLIDSLEIPPPRYTQHQLNAIEASLQSLCSV